MCQRMRNSTGMTTYGKYRNYTTKHAFIIVQNLSTSPECIDQARFIGCYLYFPGCDRTTSVFWPRRFCKELCHYFEKECRTFLEALKDIFLPMYPTKEALLNCLEKPSRNAGDSPECVYYNRKESLEKEGMLVSQSIIGISDSARRKELCVSMYSCADST